jgi:4-amino-4-deoxy-L-arabinose transferase-like glycosyltransferase
LVWWIGWRLFGQPQARLAAALYACCPVAFLCASRIWIDGFVAMWVTAAVAAMVWCLDQKSNLWFALPGTALGLALLSKFPAIATLGPLLLLWTRSGRKFHWLQPVWFTLPVIALVAPWLHELWGVYHGFGYTDNRIPDADLLRYPFLFVCRQRPAWFYVGGLMMVAPVHLFSYGGAVRLVRTRWDVVAWPLAFILAFTVYGAAGNTFQTRFIAPAMPGLCLLAADLIWTYRGKSWLTPVVAVMALYGLGCGYYAGIENRVLGEVVPGFYHYWPTLFPQPPP